MTRGCQSDQQHGGPGALHTVGEHHRYDADCTNEHGHLASGVNRAAALN